MEITKVFVIIVTYNGKQWYDRCFSSLLLSELPVHIVVVDNASSDDTVEYIQTHFPEVHLIASDKNLGFGQGNNKGISYALDRGADYVFLLNQDAWIEPDTISKLIAVHKENPQYGILSPMHLNADKTDIEKGLINYVADLKITDSRWINDLYFTRLKDVYDTSYVNAAAWLLPRKTIETVGGFDPIFYHYGEDDNYMQRVLFHGLKIGICPNVRVVHDTEQRVNKTNTTNQDQFKNLLVEFCDINKSNSPVAFLLYSFLKAFLKALKFRFNLSEKLLTGGIYIFKLKKKIAESRNQNIKVYRSGL